MKIKNILFITLFAGCTFIIPPHLIAIPAGPAPMGGAAPFNPNMSEEEMLAKLMEEIDAAIPEDQRKAFWAEVEAETRRLEEATAHMSDEEKTSISH